MVYMVYEVYMVQMVYEVYMAYIVYEELVYVVFKKCTWFTGCTCMRCTRWTGCMR